MIGIDIKLRTEAFQATMADFAHRLGIALPKVVSTEARFLLQEVIKWTPPFHPGKDNGVADGETARNIGKNAVAVHIVRAIYPVAADTFIKPRLQKAVQERDSAAIVAILKNSKNARVHANNPVFRSFHPTAHKNARDRRGRVDKSKGVFTFDASNEKSYVRKVQTRVGMAKGSWGEAYEAVGGKVPVWMKNAAAQSKGSKSTFINNLSDPVHPSMSVTSTALGVRGNTKMMQQIKFAIGVRTQAMVQKAKRMLSNPVKYKNLFEQYK